MNLVMTRTTNTASCSIADWYSVSALYSDGNGNYAIISVGEYNTMGNNWSEPMVAETIIPDECQVFRASPIEAEARLKGWSVEKTRTVVEARDFYARNQTKMKDFNNKALNRCAPHLRPQYSLAYTGREMDYDDMTFKEISATCEGEERKFWRYSERYSVLNFQLHENGRAEKIFSVYFRSGWKLDLNWKIDPTIPPTCMTVT